MKENEKTNTQNNNINSGDKLGYLQLIQEPICRMSTISAIFKGFAAAIVGGIAMISFKYINLIVLGLSFLPVFAFAMLDIYYLKLEKKFRYLNINFEKDEIKKAKATNWDCIKSPSIYLFYPIMIVVLVVVFILKCVKII
jgi:hypothetical protein